MADKFEEKSLVPNVIKSFWNVESDSCNIVVITIVCCIKKHKLAIVMDNIEVILGFIIVLILVIEMKEFDRQQQKYVPEETKADCWVFRGMFLKEQSTPYHQGSTQ